MSPSSAQSERIRAFPNPTDGCSRREPWDCSLLSDSKFKGIGFLAVFRGPRARAHLSQVGSDYKFEKNKCFNLEELNSRL